MSEQRRYRFTVEKNILRLDYHQKREVVWSVYDHQELHWVSHHKTRDMARLARRFAQADAWAQARLSPTSTPATDVATEELSPLRPQTDVSGGEA